MNDFEKFSSIEKMKFLAEHPEMLREGVDFEKTREQLETTEKTDENVIDDFRKLGKDPDIFEKLSHPEK